MLDLTFCFGHLRAFMQHTRCIRRRQADSLKQASQAQPVLPGRGKEKSRNDLGGSSILLHPKSTCMRSLGPRSFLIAPTTGLLPPNRNEFRQCFPGSSREKASRARPRHRRPRAIPKLWGSVVSWSEVLQSYNQQALCRANVPQRKIA